MMTADPTGVPAVQSALIYVLLNVPGLGLLVNEVCLSSYFLLGILSGEDPASGGGGGERTCSHKYGDHR